MKNQVLLPTEPRFGKMRLLEEESRQRLRQGAIWGFGQNVEWGREARPREIKVREQRQDWSLHGGRG